MGFLRSTFLTGLLLAAACLPSAPATVNPAVTIRSLLNEMADRSAVARRPSPSYILKQSSSHDQRKKDPGDSETWHSNTDYGQFLHTETSEGRREWVIMEDSGPGAIVRFWIPLLADKDNQVIRFYLDGAAKPAISARINDLLAGKDFIKPPFAFVAWDETDLRNQIRPDYKAIRGVAGDLYLPIPYAKSCKITLDSAPFYYVINYRQYEPGSRVQTFSAEALAAEKTTLDRVAEQLLHDPAPAKSASEKSATLGTNQEVSLDLRKGAAAVNQLQVKIDPKEPAALRSLIVQAEFDGEQTVWCPASEFFGAGARLSPVRDWWRSAGSGGVLVSRWVMPYRRSGRVTLKNVGTKPLTVTLGASTGPWRWEDRSMLFHAKWRCQHDLATRPRSDWNFVEVNGEGRYVGDTLTVYSPARDWYGEGDERIYVDGATYPAHIGTGTEDYYGMAWGMAGYFSSPYLSMPRRDRTDRGDWRGCTTNSRLRLLDSIPFTTGIKHDMEVWNWADIKVDYAVGTFWYARPGAKDNREPQPSEAAIPVKRAPEDFRIAGAVEIEDLPILNRAPGLETQIQSGGLKEGEWSGGRQLFVLAKGPGDYVEISLPAADGQPKNVVLYGTKSHDYGILRFTVNGRPAVREFDGYSAEAAATGPIELGRFTPVDGRLLLRIEVAGANPSSKGPRFYFGLDCATLKP